MISIASTVISILNEDALAMEMLERGLLNVSAYAKEILSEVEARAKKPVQLGTVVVALSRVGKHRDAAKPFNPTVKIDNLSVTSNLSELSYDKTDVVLTDVSAINTAFIDNTNAFFTMTLGVHEVTIICSADIRERVSGQISVKAKVELNDLVAVSVRFSSKHMNVPNTIYSIVGALAVRQINVMEIVSTYTELTFVVYSKELETTIQALKRYSEMKTTPTTKSVA